MRDQPSYSEFIFLRRTHFHFLPLLPCPEPLGRLPRVCPFKQAWDSLSLSAVLPSTITVGTLAKEGLL